MRIWLQAAPSLYAREREGEVARICLPAADACARCICLQAEAQDERSSFTPAAEFYRSADSWEDTLRAQSRSHHQDTPLEGVPTRQATTSLHCSPPSQRSWAHAPSSAAPSPARTPQSESNRHATTESAVAHCGSEPLSLPHSESPGPGASPPRSESPALGASPPEARLAGFGAGAGGLAGVGDRVAGTSRLTSVRRTGTAGSDRLQLASVGEGPVLDDCAAAAAAPHVPGGRWQRRQRGRVWWSYLVCAAGTPVDG